MKRLNYGYQYRLSQSGIKHVFGELDGVPFSFPAAFGRSSAIERIIQATGCTYQDAYDAYDSYIYGQESWPVLSFDSYGDYLNDSVWAARRKKALRRDAYMCSRCGSKRNLNVHHLTYKRIGREDPDDLVVLCRRCHAFIHGIDPEV